MVECWKTWLDSEAQQQRWQQERPKNNRKTATAWCCTQGGDFRSGRGS